MGFEKTAAGGSQDSTKVEKKEPEKTRELFRLEKKIGKFQVSIIVEQGSHPMRLGADWDKKKIEIAITPAGLKGLIEILRSIKDNKEDAEEMLHSLEEKAAEK